VAHIRDIAGCDEICSAIRAVTDDGDDANAGCHCSRTTGADGPGGEAVWINHERSKVELQTR
jgi:hypothetical protein